MPRRHMRPRRFLDRGMTLSGFGPFFFSLFDPRLFVLISFSFFDRDLHSLGWLQTCYMAENGLDFLIFLPSPLKSGSTPWS